MRRIRSTYHTLHVLKSADPKLRKAIVANCNKETLKGICECALNVLRGNIPLTACGKRKLQKHKSSLRKLADRARLSPPSARSSIRRWISATSIKRHIAYSGRPPVPPAAVMLREMYLVSPEQFKRCAGVKTKKCNKEHDYDKWIKMSKKIREEDVTRKAQTKNVANFLKQVLPPHPTFLRKKNRVNVLPL